MRRHTLDGGFDRRRIAEVILPQRLQVIIEFVHQRNARGNVELNDVGFRNVIERIDNLRQKRLRFCSKPWFVFIKSDIGKNLSCSFIAKPECSGREGWSGNK